MTDEQIIEMARQSGLHVATDVNWMPVIGLAYAKKLVEVAAQHEREACAKIVELDADACQSGGVAQIILKSNAAKIRARVYE